MHLRLLALPLVLAAPPALRAQSLPGYTAAGSAPELALEVRLGSYGDSAGARESERRLELGFSDA